MTIKNMDKFKDKLVKRRTELLVRIQELTRMPTQTVSGDKVDQAIASLEREDTSMHLQAEISELHEIQDALKRIERAEYGVCENCGKAIGAPRLQALPFATLCLKCKQQEEEAAEGYETRARWDLAEEAAIEEEEAE
ncbi:MAG TPA: TraR/DksA C4-type zinc finger protein [Planctomycetota bacterium]|nr:TraR/DksA C4-type zinc finger protein [Planctomycetota bacterium]